MDQREDERETGTILGRPIRQMAESLSIIHEYVHVHGDQTRNELQL